MNATCGENGGVDRHGKPCGSPPVRHVQDLDGRCRHHGDLGGEPRRQALAEAYARREAQEQARTRFRTAKTALFQARMRAARVILEARPVFDELATATEEFEEAHRVCKQHGVRWPE